MTSPPTIYHYLDIGRLGRGEVVNLFLKDTGIDFKDVRYPYDNTWPDTSKKLRQSGLTRTGQLPALEYGGSVITQHIPILRYLSRELGAYDGTTNWEKYLVDAVSDIYVDWRSQWVAILKGVTEAYRNYVPTYYDLLAQYYSDVDGPYLLGDKITYADFAVYQSIDNDKRTGTLPETLSPALTRLVGAIETRPNISTYIEETRDRKA
ncbi:Glutathione S-transferase/chloride channel [Penicillium brevicompactum]|uniref:Glutathione S-transferase/chloride channel C-terminal n=1 Tax=Penicillium brevicompactum TaxID=5074 RepID=UPI002542228A|nr:Glutathione S-transferase/chloride channel C-terminal [Penicillium brevicompactum]KAJ5332165.1 Glutathione S-transferase/chloride channel C-terminal [Penicillium brevicompactum]